MAMPRASASAGDVKRSGLPSNSISPTELVDAGEHLGQRRLAGAVLADDRVDLARGQREIDVLDRGNAAKFLGRALRIRGAGSCRVALRRSADVESRRCTPDPLAATSKPSRPFAARRDAVHGAVGAAVEARERPHRRRRSARPGRRTSSAPRASACPASCARRPASARESSRRSTAPARSRRPGRSSSIMRRRYSSSRSTNSTSWLRGANSASQKPPSAPAAMRPGIGGQVGEQRLAARLASSTSSAITRWRQPRRRAALPSAARARPHGKARPSASGSGAASAREDRRATRRRSRRAPSGRASTPQRSRSAAEPLATISVSASRNSAAVGQPNARLADS